MKVFSYLSTRSRINCIFVLLLAVAGACLAAYWPVMLSKIYDGISTGIIADLESGTSYLLLFGSVFLISEVCSIVRRVWVDRIAVSFEKSLRKMSVNKLLRLPTCFFNETMSGEYAAKINQSVTGASQLVKVICNNIVPSVFIGVFTITQVLINTQISMTLIFISYIVAEIAVSAFQIKSQNGIRESLIHRKAKVDGSICQSINNIDMIRVTNAENYEAARIEPFINDIGTIETKHHMYMGGFDIAKQSLKVIYTLVIIAVSLLLAANGQISKGMVITVALLFQQLVVPIDAIHAFMDELASSRVKSKELIKLMTNKDDDIFDETLAHEAMPSGDLHVNELTVYTPDRSRIICKNKNFVFKEGEVTALCGPAGSGKSSVLKGMMRLYPSDGDISVGSYSFKDVSQKDLCNGIYNMVQHPIFVAGSIEDNLLYGLEDHIPDKSELIDALKKAGIYNELYNKNKDVLSIAVAEHGSNFSGGQRQRIVLARAFLRKPKWFFVDEATSSIDNKMTDKVFDTLKTYAKSIHAGIVCISHQDNVVAKCDHIVNVTAA